MLQLIGIKKKSLAVTKAKIERLRSDELDLKILVLLSGGVDSTTALKSNRKSQERNVIALKVSFMSQKHNREIKSSIELANYYGVEHLYLDLTKIFKYSDCSLLKQSNEKFLI